MMNIEQTIKALEVVNSEQHGWYTQELKDAREKTLMSIHRCLQMYFDPTLIFPK